MPGTLRRRCAQRSWAGDLTPSRGASRGDTSDELSHKQLISKRSFASSHRRSPPRPCAVWGPFGDGLPRCGLASPDLSVEGNTVRCRGSVGSASAETVESRTRHSFRGHDARDQRPARSWQYVRGARYPSLAQRARVGPLDWGIRGLCRHWDVGSEALHVDFGAVSGLAFA